MVKSGGAVVVKATVYGGNSDCGGHGAAVGVSGEGIARHVCECYTHATHSDGEGGYGGGGYDGNGDRGRDDNGGRGMGDGVARLVMVMVMVVGGW